MSILDRRIEIVHLDLNPTQRSLDRDLPNRSCTDKNFIARIHEDLAGGFI